MRDLIIKFYWITILILRSVLLAESVYAQSSNLLINEIFVNPKGSDKGYEWIELYNNTDQDINLKGYTLEVAGSVWKTVFEFDSKISILPSDYFLICGQEVEGCDFYLDKIGMQNGGTSTDGVRLVSETGVVIDTFLYDTPNSNELKNDLGVVELDDNCFSSIVEDKSISRVNFIDTNIAAKDFILSDEISPGRENVSKSCQIDEIPEGSSCFVDLYVPKCQVSEYKCYIHDKYTGAAAFVSIDTELSTIEKTYLKGLVKKDKEKFYILSFDLLSEAKKWDLEYKKLEKLEEQLYQFVTAEFELLYQDTAYLYFGFDNALIRVLKEELSEKIEIKADIQQKYIIKGVLVPYSMDQQGNNKYEIITLDIQSIGEDQLLLLTDTGKRLFPLNAVGFSFLLIWLRLVIKAFSDKIENLVNFYTIIKWQKIKKHLNPRKAKRIRQLLRRIANLLRQRVKK